MGDMLQLELVGSTAVLTLNRPERHNSLVPELLKTILARIEDVRTRPTVRAAILQANGRSFSTGGDVGGFFEHLDDLEAYANEIVGLLNQTILALLELPIPLIVAVHGMVTGGSLGLVLAADIVLVAPEASFTPYYSVVGFSPDGGWTAMLPEIIGPKRTATALALNQRITAEEAMSWGLADRIVGGEQIRQEALKVAEEISAMQPGSLRYAKKHLLESQGNLAERLERERLYFVQQIMTQEAKDGMAAFLERRR